MRGILLICVTGCLFMASPGASTTVTAATTIANTTTTNSTLSAATTNSTTAPTTARTNPINGSTVSTTNTPNQSPATSNSTVGSNSTEPTFTGNTTEPTVSPATHNASNSNFTEPTFTGNTTEPTVSPATQNASNSNVTEPTSSSPVTTPSQNTTEPTGSPSNTTTTPPTASPGTCADNPCGNVLCVPLFNGYACRCSPGFVFINSSCQRGDAFYGELIMNVANFKPETTTEEYTAVFNEVMKNFKSCFVGYDYLGTTILEIGQNSLKSTRNTGVTVKVANIFTPGAVNQATVESAIDAYSKANSNFGTYSKSSICASGVYCDAATTDCAEDSSGQSAVCTCKKDLYSSQLTVTTCRECAPECSSDNGKQCKQGGLGIAPSCVCLPGYKSKDSKCTKCDFGYSGSECKDNYLLILVIVAAVLGAAVLALLGAVIGVSVTSKKVKSGERVELIEEDTPSPPRTLFPKIQMKTDLGQVNQAANVYDDDDQEFRRSLPKRDYDENPWYEMSKQNRNY